MFGARSGPGGKPFALKKKRVITARSCGQLYLVINADDASAGRGAFKVTITAK